MNRKTRLEDFKGPEVERLKKIYFDLVNKHTPEDIKKTPIFDLKNEKAFKIRLTKELVEKWHLRDWFNNYKKEAMISTAGIRGIQNVLYPWDTRFPINQLGIAMATLAKALVLKEELKGKDIHKICSGEVRYNTDSYIDIISRIQTAMGIHTHIPINREKTSVWMTSFLIFILDFDGGEYVTSSHALSSKIATKDLDNEGSQFIPDMSIKFVDKIEQILKKAESKGFEIEFAKADCPLIIEDIDGIDLYTEYLRQGVATKESLQLIRDETKKGMEIMFECLGGCIYPITSRVFKNLNIDNTFVWNNPEPNPFFHGVGKVIGNPITKKQEFFDWGCDTVLTEVILTLGYEQLLKNKPIGYLVMMIDPDGDRISLGQLESTERKAHLDKLGIRYITIDDQKVFTYYTPNQSFFLTMNYHAEQLKNSGLWDNHPRFIIKTTPSAASWDEWARKNNVSVIEVPVGFKEIATIMRKVEKQIMDNPNQEVKLHDVYGNLINLGVQPRLLFAGEESGGMITGSEELMKSKKGRIAISMREKSAEEAAIIISTLAATLHQKKIMVSDYMTEIFSQHDIQWKYDVRIDQRLYNENNPDPESMKIEKAKGEIFRDHVDNFFLSLSLTKKTGKIDLDQTKVILQEAFPDLEFDNLSDIFFVGDATYFRFSDKYVEIRKSGTDAIIKGYSAGANKEDCLRYAETMCKYDGSLTKTFKKLIPDTLYQNAQETSLKLLRKFQEKV